jgi:hypothetical protein
MFEIPLTQGKVALIDDLDFELISEFKWCTSKKGNVWYALRGVKLGTNRWTTQHMHTLITGWNHVDHIDGNGLNNQRFNLRKSNQRLNNLNQHSNWGKSKYKGVCWLNREQKWHVRIRLPNGIRKHIGYFDDEELAAKAYDEAIYGVYGNLVRLNFPRQEG